MKHDCQGCGLAGDRRSFLREALGIALGMMLPVSAVTGTRVPGRFELSFPVPAEDGATIDKANELILVRYHGMVYAFALSCPHQNTALRWLPADGRFQCPKHKSKYQPDGTFIEGRATRNMDRLPIRTDGKLVFVDADRVYESDKDPAGWAAAAVKV